MSGGTKKRKMSVTGAGGEGNYKSENVGRLVSCPIVDVCLRTLYLIHRK